jgi:hypothetical protein
VDRILAKYPKESGQCAEAAKEIMPHAQEQDHGAKKMRLESHPGDGILIFPLLSPRVSVGGRKWYYHVLVETAGHCVDALTLADGTSKPDYLDAHFNYSDTIVMFEVA